jgi:hypothetical protein
MEEDQKAFKVMSAGEARKTYYRPDELPPVILLNRGGVKEHSISRIMQSLLVSYTQSYHKHHRSGVHVWQGRFKSPVIQNDEHLLTALRYIEANPLRARFVRRAEEYPWSSYPHHGAGQANELLDRLALYEELARSPAARQHAWGEKCIDPSKTKPRRPSAEQTPRGCRLVIRRGSSGWPRNWNSISPSVHAADHEN